MTFTAPTHGIRIAVTAFGPFPGVPFNASAALVEHLAEEARRVPIPGVELVTAILPVDWTAAHEESRRLIEASKPHAILHFGVSARAMGFKIERYAVNSTNGGLDESGAPPMAEQLRDGAPARLAATLPAGPLALALNLAGVDAAVSDNGGRYICNAVFYETLLHCAGQPQPPLAVFIHMPVVLKETIAAEPPDQQWQTLLKGGELILRFAAQLCTSR